MYEGVHLLVLWLEVVFRGTPVCCKVLDFMCFKGIQSFYVHGFV